MQVMNQETHLQATTAGYTLKLWTVKLFKIKILNYNNLLTKPGRILVGDTIGGGGEMAILYHPAPGGVC